MVEINPDAKASQTRKEVQKKYLTENLEVWNECVNFLPKDESLDSYVHRTVRAKNSSFKKQTKNIYFKCSK